MQVLAATIDGKAAGESLVEKQSVAASILNRVALASSHPPFGDGTVRGRAWPTCNIVLGPHAI
jgi:hypothetical protein